MTQSAHIGPILKEQNPYEVCSDVTLRVDRALKLLCLALQDSCLL